MKTLLAYWYHFAIMFEALFVLTTIDAGTRIGRFFVQELVGRAWPKFGETNWLPGSILSTFVIVAAWSYFILTGSIATLWPMFGVANQLLASAALCLGTSIILREAKRQAYALVTILPFVFLTVTTVSAGVEAIRTLYYPMIQRRNGVRREGQPGGHGDADRLRRAYPRRKHSQVGG